MVLKVKPEKQITFAGASRGMFFVAKGTVMTVDWLDFCVEVGKEVRQTTLKLVSIHLISSHLLLPPDHRQHISKFAKHFKDFKQPYTNDEETFRRIAEVIMSYFGRIHRQYEGVATAPTRDTIAIFPMYEVEEEGQHVDKLLSLMSNPAPEERSTVLVMYSLAVSRNVCLLFTGYSSW